MRSCEASSWEKIQTVREYTDDVRAWITTIARNVVIDHVRSAHVRREVSMDHDIEVTRVMDSAESAALLRQLQADVQAAIAQLTRPQRECVFLRFYRGCSVEKTARAMDSTAGAVRALQYRALRHLAAIMAQPVAVRHDVAGCAA